MSHTAFKSILIISLLLFFFCQSSILSQEDFTWSDEAYEQYNYETFALIEKTNNRIDMKHIDYPLLHAAVFYETNKQRVLNKKLEFKHSPALEKAAKNHSDDMVTYDFFSHESKVKGKRNMSDRLALVGITQCYTGENIAYTFGIEYKAGKSVYSPVQNGGYFSYTYKGKPIEIHTYLGLAKEVVNNWMNSPGHKANILNKNFSYLGTGAAHYQDSDFYNMDNFKFTQNFASIKGK